MKKKLLYWSLFSVVLIAGVAWAWTTIWITHLDAGGSYSETVNLTGKQTYRFRIIPTTAGATVRCRIIRFSDQTTVLDGYIYDQVTGLPSTIEYYCDSEVAAHLTKAEEVTSNYDTHVAFEKN